MTTDPFTEAAREYAKEWNRHAEESFSRGEECAQGVDEESLIAGAEWARAHLAAQEPTDAEVEAALTALLISESIALGQTADEAADYAIRELETRDLTNLRTGVRCALRYARAARRDEEDRP